MIDRSFTPSRLPDIRVTEVQAQLLTGHNGFDEVIEAPERSMLFVAIEGDFRLETTEKCYDIPPGTAVGFQLGRKHRWTGASSCKGPFALFMGSISRRAAVLQGLTDDVIIVPPDALPTATMLSHIVAILIIEIERRERDAMILRRCAEMIQGELIRYASSTGVRAEAMAADIAHDAQLLRAWSAYFADPRRRWTIAALAREAGLGRTAFAKRFTALMGVPPLSALTDLRLEQAVTMLRDSQAPLIEIAFTVGYSSEAAFVRAFRRRYGKPPGQFRSEGA